MFDLLWRAHDEKCDELEYASEQEERKTSEQQDASSSLYLPDGTRNRVTNPLVNLVRGGSGDDVGPMTMTMTPAPLPPAPVAGLVALRANDDESAERASSSSFAGPVGYRALETTAGYRAPPTPSVEDAYRAANRHAITTEVNKALDVSEPARVNVKQRQQEEGDEDENNRKNRRRTHETTTATTTTTGMAVVPPLPPLAATADMSAKTPVMRRFVEAVAAAEGAESTHVDAASRLQDVLAGVKRASDELRFRGQEREQLAAMASLGADMLEAFQSAITADRVLRGAALAAADEADQRIDAVEQRLVRERAARNRAAAEFARVAVEKGVGGGGGGGGGGGVDAMTASLMLMSGAAAEEQPQVTTTAVAPQDDATTTVPVATREEAVALAVIASSSSSAAELKTLRDKLERAANDYDRVKRSLAWSEELRAEAEVEAGSKVSAAQAEARLAVNDARLAKMEVKEETERRKGLESELAAAREDLAQVRDVEIPDLERQLADAEILRETVNNLGRGKTVAEDERDALAARIREFDALASAVEDGGGGGEDLLSATTTSTTLWNDPAAIRRAVTAERWRAVSAEDNCKLARDEAAHWKTVADNATRQLDAMQSEMVDRLEAQCAALNVVIERERESLGASAERAERAERRCAELRHECEEAFALRAESEAKAAGSAREALVALESAAEEAEKATRAMAAATLAEEEAERAKRDAFEYRAALAVVRDQDITAAVERGIEQGAKDRLTHLRLQLGLATAEVAQLLRERDAAREQIATADKHIEAAVAFERASQRDARAAAEVEFEGRLREATTAAMDEGRALAREAEVRRSMAETTAANVGRELEEARREIDGLKTQLSAAEASIAAVSAVSSAGAVTAATMPTTLENGVDEAVNGDDVLDETHRHDEAATEATKQEGKLLALAPAPALLALDATEGGAVVTGGAGDGGGSFQTQLAAAVRAAVDVVQASARREAAAMRDALDEALVEVKKARDEATAAAAGWAAEADAAAEARVRVQSAETRCAALQARIKTLEDTDRDFETRVDAEVLARSRERDSKTAEVSSAWLAINAVERETSAVARENVETALDEARRIAEANAMSREAALAALEEERAAAAAAIEAARGAQAAAAAREKEAAAVAAAAEEATAAAERRAEQATALGLKQVTALQRQLDEERARARNSWLWTSS